MPMRRQLAAAASGAVALSGGVLAPAAAVVPSAVRGVDAWPENVVVDASYEWVNFRLYGISRTTSCVVKLENRATWQPVAVVQTRDGQSTGRLKVLDYLFRPGVQRLVAQCADTRTRKTSVRFDDILMKFRSYSVLHSRRAGATVILTYSASRHARFNTRVPTQGGNVQVQKLLSGSWSTFRYVRTDRQGQATVTTTNANQRTYRAVLAETPAAWPSVSNTVQR